MFNRHGKSLWVVLTASTLMTLGVAASAQAETRWEHNHPRRDQVNDRLEREHARIRHEVREGEMSPRRAARGLRPNPRSHTLLRVAAV